MLGGTFMKMKKAAIAVMTGCMLFAGAVVQATPMSDLTAALDKKQDPAGSYKVVMTIPFKTLKTMVSTTNLDLQTSPYCARAVIVTTIGGENPETSTIYDIQEGNKTKTYSQKYLHKGDKEKSWVYRYNTIEGSTNVIDSVKPESLLKSVKDVSEISNGGGVEHLRVTFDNAKLYSGFGVTHAIKSTASDDAKTDEDFEKEFEKLRKSGDSFGDAYIANGNLTKFTMDITKPVKAFENVIIKGVSRKSHTGAMGNWILGMLLKTGDSNLTVDLAPLSGRVSIPQAVINAAVPDPDQKK
jgi:hypothetical protein